MLASSSCGGCDSGSGVGVESHIKGVRTPLGIEGEASSDADYFLVRVGSAGAIINC